jgi:hypothetical protein
MVQYRTVTNTLALYYMKLTIAIKGFLVHHRTVTNTVALYYMETIIVIERFYSTPQDSDKHSSIILHENNYCHKRFCGTE